MAPTRQWNPTVSQATPRPDESKKPGSSGYAWTKALSVRCAIGNGKAATWEQGSFAAYEAFANLSKLIMAQWSTHSQNGVLLPLVQQTSVEKRELPSGSANVPVFTIVRWVPRPDCLKADAPIIAAVPEAVPVQQAQAAAPVVPVAQPTPASVPADVAF
jgi:hypothetical protein